MRVPHSRPPAAAERPRPFPVQASVGRLICWAQGLVETVEARAGAGEASSKWAVLWLAGVGTFMTTLDASIVNISLPSIGRAFHVPLGGAIEWVIIAYLVVIVAVLLTASRLADMIGRRPIFSAGVAVFTLASAACGSAPSMALLVAARGVQGGGAALIAAVNVAMITDAFPAGERGRALGLNAILIALGVAIGPSLGGFITQALTWRWIFYVNLPVGALVLLGSWLLLRERARRRRERFDPAGAATLGVGFAALALGLSFGQEWGWTSALVLGTLAGAAVLLGAAALIERRTEEPIVRLELFRNPLYARPLLSYILAMLGIFAVSFLLPYYFEQLRGFSVEQSGFLLSPLAVALAAAAPGSGALSDRVGSRWLSAGGLAVATMGLVLLSRLDARSDPWAIVWRLAVAGIGMGIFSSPNTKTIMNAAPRAQRGVASGMYATGRVIGQALSVAIAGAVFTTFGGAGAGARLAAAYGRLPAPQLLMLQSAFARGFQTALLLCAAFTLAAALLSLTRGD
jgi:EmrB/QacA subfamily drug resistance transporter